MHYIDILKDLTKEEAYNMVFEIAKTHPELIENFYLPNYELDGQGRLKNRNHLKEYVQKETYNNGLTKIECIKLAREASGMGLKEAKTFVEENIYKVSVPMPVG